MKEYRVEVALMQLLANGQFHSGQKLGMQLGMSRVAINQHIQILKSWGIQIQTVTGKGYCLSAPIALLNKERIAAAVTTDGGDITVLPVVDSTNQFLMNKSGQLTQGEICIAEYQYAGRGRRGRAWHSPFGANLYFSMYWKLEQGPAAAMGLSLATGIIIAETLREISQQPIKVKWPNDIYLNDRKLAGILVEMQGKTGDVAHVIIGAGINLAMQTAEECDINQRWTNLHNSEQIFDRNQLCALLIDQMRIQLYRFELEGLEPFIARWKQLDNFINRPVQLIIGERTENGIARGIDNQGALLLEQDGKVKPWLGGEISLRPAS
jgi:BirA family transcriptional regulator, biotin operon repressor / biotin---[acetyl-CoA-carboxylase] ligase